VATEIAWFNASGAQIGTGDSVTVDNPGTFAVMVTTEDCQSLFGGWVVIDAGLDCTMSAEVDVVNAEEGEDNGSATVVVDGASGPWTATWYSSAGLLLGSGPSIDNLAEGQYSVLVVDSIGCSVEVESFDVLTGLEELQRGSWTAFPNPASHALTLAGLPVGSSWAMLTLEGRVVQSGMGRVQDVIHLSEMPGGVYLIQVASSKGVSFQRVLVQH
jgi:hypothetical protein